MDEEEAYENVKKGLPVWARMFILGVLIVVVLAGMFWIGGAYSCKLSNGKVIGGFPAKCVGFDVIAACEELNMLYPVKPEVASWWHNLTNEE